MSRDRLWHGGGAAVVANVKTGDRVIGARAMFASCLWILDTLLPKFGVDVELVDGEDLDQWRAAAAKGVKLSLIETPANPTLGGVDIQAVADIIHGAGGKLIVDNVFASPVLQKPISSSIRRPSTSTGKAARSAARSSAAKR